MNWLLNSFIYGQVRGRWWFLAVINILFEHQKVLIAELMHRIYYRVPKRLAIIISKISDELIKWCERYFMMTSMLIDWKSSDIIGRHIFHTMKGEYYSHFCHDGILFLMAKTPHLFIRDISTAYYICIGTDIFEYCCIKFQLLCRLAQPQVAVFSPRPYARVRWPHILRSGKLARLIFRNIQRKDAIYKVLEHYLMTWNEK